METNFKTRFDFAMSSFSRMYGVNKVRTSPDIIKFCTKWAKTEEEHPVGSLTSIDFYFRDNWEIWGEYV
jgi:hypothetical protein